MNIRSELGDSLLYILSRKYKKKIVLIESDDWGSVRLRSQKDYESLIKTNLLIDDAFLRIDSLESDEDLNRLFDLLSGIRNEEGVSPKLTANFIMSNPDFSKISDAHGERYFHRGLEDTYSLSENSQSCKKILDRANAAHLVQPEFHGREHVNIERWMRFLKEYPEYRKALRYNSYIVKRDKGYNEFGNTVAALDVDHPEDVDKKKEQLKQGLDMFLDYFGFAAKSFVAPNYIWNSELHPVLEEMGITSIQTSRFQNMPYKNKSGVKRKFHWTGTRAGFFFSVRNVVFEPVLYGVSSEDYVGQTLSRISKAFRYGNAVNIGTHRVNYVSGMQPSASDQGLKALEKLLEEVVRLWPDVYFCTTRELSAGVE